MVMKNAYTKFILKYQVCNVLHDNWLSSFYYKIECSIIRMNIEKLVITLNTNFIY